MLTTSSRTQRRGKAYKEKESGDYVCFEAHNGDVYHVGGIFVGALSVALVPSHVFSPTIRSRSVLGQFVTNYESAGSRACMAIIVVKKAATYAFCALDEVMSLVGVPYLSCYKMRPGAKGPSVPAHTYAYHRGSCYKSMGCWCVGLPLSISAFASQSHGVRARTRWRAKNG